MPLMATFDPSAAFGGSSPSEGALWGRSTSIPCAPHNAGKAARHGYRAASFVYSLRT